MVIGAVRRRLSPRVRWVLLGMLVLIALAVMVAWSATAVQSLRTDLTAVQADLQRGVDAASAGDTAQASDAFASAGARSARAVDLVQSPPVRLVGFLPVADDVIASTTAVTEAANLVARSGDLLLTRLNQVPGGLDGLTLGSGDDGWLAAVSALQAPAADARAMLDLALDLVVEAPEVTAVAQVDDAREQLQEELESILPTIENATALAEVLPALFGADGPRRYFLGAQNPAELRGTGGLIGAYAILTTDNGAVDISSFTPVQELGQDLFTEETAPSAEFYDLYDSWITGVGSWLNVNISPDFPSVAQTIEAMYEASEGERLDGVIVVDPFALEAMLEATGPVTSADSDVGELRAETVVDFITNRAPVALGLGGDRKEVLGEAARAVLSQFLGGEVPGQARLQALATAITGGHVLVHAADPAVQAAMARVGIDGALPDPTATSLSVAVVNQAESKADYWLDRQVTWDINLDPDGTASAIVTLALRNDAPSSDLLLPSYIIGPGTDQTIGRGGSLSLVSVLCGTCQIFTVFHEDVREFGTRIGTEAGHTGVTVQALIAPDSTQEIRYTLELPDAWQRSGRTGVFEPTFWTPPSINGTDVTIQVTAPDGWQFLPSSTAPDLANRTTTMIGADDVRRLDTMLTLQEVTQG